MKSVKSILFYAAAVLSFVNLFLFTSLISMWSGIRAMSTAFMPYLLFIILFILAFLCFYLWLFQKRPLGVVLPVFIIELAFVALEGYILSCTKDSWVYFIRQGRTILIYAFSCAGLILFGILCSITHLSKHKTAVFLLTLATVLFIVLLRFLPLINKIEGTPVVYAVSDHYQIVFTTRAKGTGWVTINGKTYADTSSGIRVCDTTIHKITVPQKELDCANSYTVGTKGMILCGPYLSLTGKTITKDFSWRGADFTDGMQYYALADTHCDTNACVKAASYYGDELDFLILAGDMMNWAQEPYSMNYLLSVAQKVTKGEVPVVFARGNHEARGILATELTRYAGCQNDSFYYTFRIKNLWGIVLDLGQDHPDDYQEFSGLSEFNSYRMEETKFLQKVLTEKEKEYDQEDVTYRIAICHIPLTILSKNDFLKSYKKEWINYLNQMKINLLFQGHLHQLFYVEPNQTANRPLTFCHDFGANDTTPDFYTTNANFPSVFVSRKNTSQLLSVPDDTTHQHFIGLKVSADEKSTKISYTNEAKNVLPNILSAFLDGHSYGPTITIFNK